MKTSVLVIVIKAVDITMLVTPIPLMAVFLCITCQIGTKSLSKIQ